MVESKKALSHLIQGAIYSCCNLFAGILLGLILTPFLLSTLGERSYGIYSFAELFTGWCGLVDFGLTTTAARFITLYYTNKDRQGLLEIGNTVLILFSILGLIVLIISGLTAFFMKTFGASIPDIDLLCLVVLISGGGFALSKLIDGVCGIINGVMRQELSGRRILFFRIIYGFGAFVILYWGGRVIALVLFNVLLILLQLIILSRLIRRACPDFYWSRLFFRWGRVRELFRYSIYTFITQVGDLMIVRSDLLLIMWLFSMEKMAGYKLVVVTFMSYYSSFMTALTTWQTNWFTHLLTLNEEDALQKWRGFLYKISTWLTIFMSFGLIVWGKPFIGCWIGFEYQSIFPCLILCASASALCRGHSEINLRYLQGIAKHGTLAVLVLLQGILNIILSMTFVHCGLDLFGIALGTVLPMILIHHVVVPILVCRMRNESILRYYALLMNYQFTALLALILPALISYWLVQTNYLSLVLSGSLSLGCYLLFLYLLGLNQTERSTLRTWLKK